MNEDSVCVRCINFMVKGKWIPATLESPEEEPEIYCDIGNDENFGTPCGCWDYKEG